MKEKSQETGERLLKLVHFFAENYFRAKFFHAEPEVINTSEPVIFAGNHSGMCFPWDNFVLFDHLLSSYGKKRELRGLMTPMMIDQRLLSPFAMPVTWNFFSRPAVMQEFDALVSSGHSILINPEGLGGIGKGFNYRYQIQKVSSSFVRMSLKHKVAIIPVSVVNGEYLNPFAYSSKSLNKFVSRLGLPFLPIGPMLLTPLIFPFMLYVALPARLRYVFGKRIFASDYTDKSYDELSDSEVREITAKIQALMQTNLDQAVSDHEQPVFGVAELIAHARGLGWKALGLMPVTWPFLAHYTFLGDDRSLKSRLVAAATAVSTCIPILGWPTLLCVLGVAKIFEKENRAPGQIKTSLQKAA